ncbi:restriction endonuclease subunit S [Streptomyces sp. ME02-6987-2C]|uniref:restriction endonuclease subunit S n=1 Tax=unclassified Streptomyces TaxID=2593676 RepID=UPI0029A6A132|nr:MULTISPECIES: restriction endonuclease subunit S [unclassified Streptomyces]MDX3365018.1 restriction endonuclease subunit S [Streptomyces sp. ME02-6987-2C]MDX3420781.1 restriction endonuclease subunit S [Streptomyces sp. ME02-6985-2c]
MADWSAGGTPKATNRSFYDGGDMPWAIISDIQNGPLVETAKRITQAGLEAIGGTKKIVPEGTVLVSMYGSVGRSAIARIPMATNQAIARGVVNDQVSAEYLFLWLNAHEGHLDQMARGATQRNINKQIITAFPIALPPAAVQERIVEVISTVDNQIAALSAEAGVLENVYRAATSLLWCTAEGVEAETWLLGEVMRFDVTRIPMEAGATYHLAGVLNAGKGLVDKGEFDGAETEYTAMNVLRENQVVMRKLTAWEGPITVVPAEFDSFVASNEFPTFTLADDIASGWMKHVCRTPRLWAEMQSRVVGTVQRRKRLNPDQLLSVALPIPSRTEQEQAAEALDVLEGQVAVLRAEATRLRAVRARLLLGLLDRTIDIESAEPEV